MAVDDQPSNRDGRLTEELGVEFVCAVTQSLFKSRKSLREATFENCLNSGKRWLRRTLESAAVRQAIGASPQQWVDINQVFYIALPQLEAQSIPSEMNVSSGATTSSALMTLNYDTLMKDLERLNDILLIARNCLATTQRAQNLAGESLLDQQVLKLIDLCVRVTARGFDGETQTRTEQPWANVIGAYKKLLITCLQFLHNFIMKNEQRKLLLWLDLFANSKVANDYAVAPGLGREQFDLKASESMIEEQRIRETEITERKHGGQEPNAKPKATGQKENKKPMTLEQLKVTLSENVAQMILEDSKSSMSKSALQGDSNLANRRSEPAQGAPKDHQQNTKAKHDVSLMLETNINVPTKVVKGGTVDDLGPPRTPQSAAITLQAAKDQLMARLADQPVTVEDVNSPDRVANAANPETGPQGPLSEEEEEDFREHEPEDQQRGLLTDIPLVLGLHEIEALPMIIQIGICPGLGSVLHGRDMQSMRCNILLAGDAGRNLLRELLIFIAAWDLQDDEIYFKLMMQIMEAILENGLMPYAYQSFSEVKDIVSPAQSMVIKILTQIFRGKQTEAGGKDKGKGNSSRGKSNDTKAELPINPHSDASRRVNIYIVRYIFTIFRSSIIPETCALIYLQGQIKAGAALPEDFPLNLWDMERVYEGVYQFLEFFAVLTESEEWKDLLVSWEITSELITLLRELEASIPKAPITASSIPQTEAEAQAAALEQEAQPSKTGKDPVAVERPFDISTNGASPSAAPNENYGSLLPTVDMSEQESDESADPSDFEWRNLKKLVILVLSSLVWKSPTVQNQIRQYGGVEMVLACCTYDANNPYIREHAIMCLRFLLEGCGENKEIVEKLQELGKGPLDDLESAGMDGMYSSKKSDRGRVEEVLEDRPSVDKGGL